MRPCSLAALNKNATPTVQPPQGIQPGSRTPYRAGAPISSAKLTGDAVDMKLISQVVSHSRKTDAIRCSKNLALKEGIFVGISSGATFAGALQVAASAAEGSTILCMLPDTGERYLSTPLFADVSTDMTQEELEISHSTPGCWL